MSLGEPVFGIYAGQVTNIASARRLMRMARNLTPIVITVVLLLPPIGILPVAAQEPHQPPLLLPFPAGAGTIISGYENGSFHDYANAYALDLCPDTGCVIGTSEVLAPTDLTYDLPVDANNVQGDPSDYHIFQIEETATEHVCLALGHFDLTAPGTLVDGKRTFQRGEPMGALLDYQYTDKTSHPHYHINLFTVDKAYRCGVSDDDHTKRRALAFTDAYLLDDMPYQIGGPQEHLGKAVVSHNVVPGASAPGSTVKVAWSRGTTRTASHVPLGEPVTLVARIDSPTDVEEVRFTAYYPDWANQKDAAKVAGFDPKRTWRTLKVCQPKTKGCAWDGDRREATVTYRWDPTVGEKSRSIPGVPKADPAITRSSKSCVPVTLMIDAVDVSGASGSAPGGKVAQRCDAKAEGLARTVYLDPLAPPAAPTNVVGKTLSTRNPGGDAFYNKVRVTWDDVSGEATYRIYRRDYYYDVEFDARKQRPRCWFIRIEPAELLDTVPADTTAYRYELFRGYGDVPYVYGEQYLVTASNRAGHNTGASREPRTPANDGLPRCR
jgi:hypothetical protein